jgi:hypothetical protein
VREVQRLPGAAEHTEGKKLAFFLGARCGCLRLPLGHNIDAASPGGHDLRCGVARGLQADRIDRAQRDLRPLAADRVFRQI